MSPKKETRKEMLKEPDQFFLTSGKILSFIKQNSQLLINIGIAIAVLVVIGVGFNWYGNRINEKGLEAYSAAYQTIIRNMQTDEGRYELEKPVELFNKVINEYGSSDAAQLAIPQVAYLKLLEGKFDEAITMYQQFMDGIPEGDPRKQLTRLALSSCYEEKGEYPRAIETLEQITEGTEDFFKEQAMLSLARVYRLTDNKAKSEEILKEFIENFEDSPSLPLVRSLLSS
ncbi:MAG: tetratricopeptide repeat protein [Deltaproteobacteria bacterium]|nr:tetratricopeptide repeat protein [Deltaproteobacteria bacterium]